ncbi:MAG: DUF2007 domain-containing protein [Oscillibacter sp.]|jgi:hypothetical protein|nr:DUF2007 domain-containing protein [Oscillibacter sp.]
MRNDNGVWGRVSRGIPKNWPTDAQGQRELPVLLTNLSEGPLADMTRNMLEAYGIPVVAVYQQDGTFARVLLGASAYGVGLYVPASRQEEARGLLEAAPGTEEDPPAGE